MQSEDLAHSLGLKTGQYAIKQSLNAARNSPSRRRKRHHKSRTGKKAAIAPENCSTNVAETGNNWASSDSVIQANSFDELNFDPQKLIEFAMSTANSKDIDDFEASTQVMQSDYLEGPVVKIAEFPSGSMAGISGGTSATTEDDMLLCYISQSSQSTTDLAGNSDSAEQNLSFKQSLMVASAPVTQNTALSFPLTLTVDGSSLENCPAFQFS